MFAGTASHSLSARAGRGWGEGASPRIVTSRLFSLLNLSAPHPDPLPARAGRGGAGAVLAAFVLAASSYIEALAPLQYGAAARNGAHGRGARHQHDHDHGQSRPAAVRP